MTTKRAFLTLLGLLLLWSSGLRPAAAQVQTAGEVQAYGNTTANYAVGCGQYSVTGYLRDNGTEMVPTTPEHAEATYTVNGDKAFINAEMTSEGVMTASGSGLDGSFLQTQTVDVAIEGTFENCSGEPFSRRYTGTQTLEGATVPGGGAGELKAFGEQTVSMSAVCETTTIRPLNQGTSNSSDNGNQGEAPGTNSVRGHLSLNLDTSSYSTVSRTGGVEGTYTQTHSVDLAPQVTGQAATNGGGLIPGVTGTTTVTFSQSNTVSTGN